MKKINFFFVFLLLVLLFNVLNIDAAAGDNLRESISDTKDKVDDTRDKIEDIKDGNVDEDKQKWDYLAEEWPKIFLKNSFIAMVDSFFSKINFVFLFLMNVNYSFSFSFLFIVMLWFFLVFNIAYLLKSTTLFDKWISWILSFLVVALIGQGGFFYNSVEWSGLLFNLIVKFVHYGVFAGFAFIIIMYLLFYSSEKICRDIRAYFIKKNRRIKQSLREEDEMLFHMLTSGMYKAITGKEKKYKRHSSDEAWEHWINRNS